MVGVDPSSPEGKDPRLNSPVQRKIFSVAGLVAVAALLAARPWSSALRQQEVGGSLSSLNQSSQVSAGSQQTDAVQPDPSSVVLGEDGGLSVAPVGTPMSAAIPAITRALGPPDYTGKWASSYCETAEGVGGRLLVWRDLGVLFTDGGVLIDGKARHAGRRVLWGYQYGGTINDNGARREVTSVRQVQPGLKTASGVGLGSTGREIKEAYGPRAQAHPGDPNGFAGPLYFVRSEQGTPGEGITLNMDANGPQGRVFVMLAGGSCGE